MESLSIIIADEKIRCRALHVIFKYSKCENFDPFVPYLAMTYFDRFIWKKFRITIPGVMGTAFEHDLELLALCCLTLAWSVRTTGFNIDKFWENQPDLKYVAKRKFWTMQNKVINKLDNSLTSKTALCFVPELASKFYCGNGFSRRTIYEIIIQSKESILINKLQPLIIAASAFLAASKYLYPDKYQSFYRQLMQDGMFKSRHEERCIEYMIKMCRDLKLVIESDHEPKRRVIAGEEPERGTAETSENGSAETSAQVTAEISEEGAAEKSEGGTAETSEHGPAQTSEQVTSETSEEGAAETSGQCTAETSEHGPAETSEQVTSETSEEGAAETSEPSAAETSGQFTAETSEHGPAETSEQVASEISEEGTAETSEHGPAETSEQVTAETSEEGAAETSEPSASETSEQEANTGADFLSRWRTAETSEQATSTELNFPLRWRICKVYGEKFVIFRPLSESAELDQIAKEASETRSQGSSTQQTFDVSPEAAPGAEAHN